MMDQIGIQSIDYALPTVGTTLAKLKKVKKLHSNVALLSSLGFEKVYIGEDHMLLAEKALAGLIKNTGLDPLSIDLFVYAGALPDSNLAVPNTKKGLTFFKYAASKLQYDFGLSRAIVLSVSQQGCVSLMNAMWLAINTLKSEDTLQTAICLSTDVLPSYASREIIYNAMSDASCALLLKKGATQNTVIAYNQISKGYYWDPEAKKNEIVAAYFPTAKLLIEKTLKKANVSISEIDWIIPHNVSKKSWEILLGLLKFPRAKLYEKNIRNIGHTIAADNFINLKDALDENIIKKGQLALLFTFGFGAHWSCTIIRH
jgi:3-oxoacyl-[acyl-carrier-protein] synthase III